MKETKMSKERKRSSQKTGKSPKLVKSMYVGASVAQWSERSPFTSEVAGSILSENVLNVILEHNTPFMRRVKPVFHLAIFFARTSKKRMWLDGDVVSVCRQPINLLFSLFARTSSQSGKQALVNTLPKVVGFLRALRFPPTKKLTGWVRINAGREVKSQCCENSYTPKNYDLFKVVENRMQQCCAAHIVHSCQQYCSALLSLNQPAIRLNNAEQYCWQLWTIWAAQHCCILFSTTLNKS